MHAKQIVAAVQSAVFVGTGIWPIVSPRSFQSVTGPKRDMWLAQTIGLLIASVGATLGVGARRRIRSEVAMLGASSAAALAICDVAFVAKRRISRVYLLDALLETGFVAGWLLPTRSPQTRLETP
ncbi:hypothetical protein LZC95_04900 [Pendulispora brunnea]|uniref:DUF4345 domain-containing protein n=1 Tax=Pendulispora brunnea TaxID=2905690 RepID=A0ABZ2KF28_9BACT